MIESSFCHLPDISLADEKELWRKGIRTWDDLLCWAAVFANDDRYDRLKKSIADSQAAVASQRPGFFLKGLPELEWYRVYHDFPDQVNCLDIETSGLHEGAEITCLSILTAGKMQSFIGADKLGAAADRLAEVRIAVTFNGTRFDIPRLMRRFSRFCPKFHIDLAKTLRKQKMHGNLKYVAAGLGWTQDETSQVIGNGEEAAQAWANYQQSRDPSILEALLTYNQKDVQRLDFILRILERRHVRESAP